MTRAQKSQISREKIIAASITEFGCSGFQNASIQHISEQSQIRKPLIFYYFANKESLFLSCLEFSVSTFYTWILEHYKMLHKSPFESIMEFMRTKTKFYQQFPDYKDFFHLLLLSPPKELYAEIQLASLRLKEINKIFLTEIFEETNLENTVKFSTAIDIIQLIEQGMHIKYQTQQFPNGADNIHDLFTGELGMYLRVLLEGIQVREQYLASN